MLAEVWKTDEVEHRQRNEEKGCSKNLQRGHRNIRSTGDGVSHACTAVATVPDGNNLKEKRCVRLRLMVLQGSHHVCQG